ncbi:hypothetical protein K523DRAFT_372617 [Schizophyllum commune Tattone D]|nr:hypothetical protein K523DRAFT_372617 [Schizophyllum commune Tattone D]
MAPRTTRIPVYVHRDAAATEGLKTPTRRKRHSSVERRTRTRTISGTSTTRPCVPTDSPRNPFGRQYKWHCLRRLPPPLNPFLSHLPLVLTLVRARSSANEPPVYRKVHVPRNYTITHLRALLIFLFDATMYDGDLFSSLHHVVEICKDADIPGNLWSAETCIKLSGVQDPYSPARDDGPELGDADEPEVSRTGSYRWEGEGDFIIDSVWPTTRFQDDEWELQNECRGIIFNFKRDPYVKVHITYESKSRSQAPHPMDSPFVVESCGLTNALSSRAPSSSCRAPTGAGWNEPNVFKKFYMTLAKGSMALLPNAPRPAIPRPARSRRMLPVTHRRHGKTPEALPAHRKAVSVRAKEIARMARSNFLRELDEMDSPPPSPVVSADEDENDPFWGEEDDIQSLLAEQFRRAPLMLDNDSDDDYDGL